MNKDKIALAMIVKGSGDEPERLRKALTSIHKWVDGIYITLTGPTNTLKEVEKVCKEFNVNVSYKEFLHTIEEKEVTWLKDFLKYDPHAKVGNKIFLFDEARNYNFSQVPKDYKWILWMDCDDVFVGGENLWKVKQIGEQAKIEAFYFNYIYQAEFDKDGNIRQIIIEHLRERLIRNTGVYKWIAPIHETLIEQTNTVKTDNYDCYIVHTAEHKDRLNSLQRNLQNLEYAIYKSEGKDPRHVYYLAKAYFDLGTPKDLDRCIPLILKYLLGEHKSGWPEERAQAYEYLAEIYRRKGEYNNAVKSAMNALIEQPQTPTIFLNLAVTYMLKQEWERALFWVKQASTIADRKSTLVKNPRDIKARTLEVIYQCCLNLGQIDEAWAAAEKLMELYPEEQYVQNNYAFIKNLKEQRDITRNVVGLAEYLKATNERHKIKALLQSVPQIAENTPFIVDLYQKNNPPTPWGDDEIVIYCGPGFTLWSPKKLSKPDGSFVGGSEEAVILMSKELAKLGWKVTVYADPGNDEGEYDGVKWLPYYKFNKLDNFNILIVWRQVGFVDQNVKAKKIYIWNHDIQNLLDWNKDRVGKITKALFLSKWHRDNVSTLPEEKVFITSNGI